MPETTALGAAMAAGKAAGIWSLNPDDLTSVTFEKYEPNARPEGKHLLSCMFFLQCIFFQGGGYGWRFV